MSALGEGAQRFRVILGDCLEELEKFDENTFHACVCDPPYHLTIAKRFCKTSIDGNTKTEGRAKERSDGYARLSRGFMGQAWDGGDIAMRPETWEKVWRVLRPGAHLLCFGGSRTFHRMACAIEDAGFEIRDTLMWVYGSGFPKSHSISKALGDENSEEWKGWGSALKPAYEPIIMARKPLEDTLAQNTRKYACGGINIDGCRIGNDPLLKHRGAKAGPNTCEETIYKEWNTPDRWDHKNPSCTWVGRWPANFLHDGSTEVLEEFPSVPGQQGKAKTDKSEQGNNIYGPMKHFTENPEPRGDAGSAARFFYCSKANKEDRAGSNHPTVKPISLLRWLCRLVTPKDGLILDPFAGSGTTLQAAFEEGFYSVGIEKEQQYFFDIVNRMKKITSIKE